jgi:IS5 family transposase
VLRTDSDLEWVFIDGRYVKAHQRSAGAAGGHDEYIGKSRACDTSKVHLAVNAYGLPEVFTITGGHINDCIEAPALIEKIDAARVLIADTGYDRQIIRDKGGALRISIIIPRKKNSIKGNKELNWPLYKLRDLLEDASIKPRHYRAVATQYGKFA